MKRIITFCITVFSLTLVNEVNAQKEDANWILGLGSGRDTSTQSIHQIQFSDSVEYSQHNIRFFMDVTNASISDSSGNLVCYTNGTYLNNSKHELIQNGGSFQDEDDYSRGYSVPQGALLLPIPDSKNLYIYLLTDFFRYKQDDITVATTKPLTYSVLDMEKNNGLGEVIEKKQLLNQDTLAPGQLTAVRHGNGRDWWVITSKYRTNKYYRYLIDPAGIRLDGIQVVGDTAWTSLGQAVFSPDGNWYARFNWYGIVPINDRKRIDLYQFDRCTGLLSEHKHEVLPGIGAPGGIAFSENSKFLYVSAWDTIYQYELDAQDILASRMKVAEFDGFTGNAGAGIRFFSMQLAPDDKIYVCVPNTDSYYFHSIEAPNEKGLACNVQQHSIRFPFRNRFSIPNMPYFRLGKWEDSPCDTIGISSVESFSLNQEIQIFPNPSNGEINISFPEIQDDLKLKIFDSSGVLFSELLLNKGETNYNFQLPPGLFIYSIQDQYKRRLKTGKIVVVE